MRCPVDLDGASSGGNDEILLDALAEWDESYQRGEDRPTTSFGLSDPALLAELRTRIQTQKELYAVLKLRETANQGLGEAATPLPCFPGYETESTIGRGGMGVVYKAHDVKLNRVVAIKTVAWAEHASTAQCDRFLTEAEAVARLKHANVIPIYAIGEHDGRPYYTLEYAAGGNLADRLAQGPMVTGKAAELLETLAPAVHAAHLAGIIHRDLKPSNVLLTAEGVPKISDFGVAKLLDSTSVRTLSGEALGTPSYMAPEQAEGRSKGVGPAADVYALGAIFYETLTGRPPFLGESAIETLKLVARAEVVSPRRLRPDVPRDLETICLKCLDRVPEKRYGTAEALALDLRRFRSGEPIRRPRGLRRVSKWGRRHPWQTALAGTLLAAALAFIALSYRYNAQLRTENRRTETKAAEARRNYLEARSAIQTMLGRLDDGRVAGSPRLIDLRRDLRQDALAFYDQILHQVDSTDPVVLADTIRALAEAAQMHYVLGDRALAQATIHRALPLISSLRSLGGDEIECLGLEVDCLMKLGAAIEVPARRGEAVSIYERLIPLADRLARAEHDSPVSADMQAACHNTYASILGRDQFELAKDHYKQAIELRGRPDVLAIRGMRNRLAQSVENLGVIHWKERDFAQADLRFRQAEEFLLSPGKDAPSPDRETSITLGQVAVNWVGLLWETKKHDEAIAARTRRSKCSKPTCASNPTTRLSAICASNFTEIGARHWERSEGAERPPKIGQRSWSLHHSPCRRNIESPSPSNSWRSASSNAPFPRRIAPSKPAARPVKPCTTWRASIRARPGRFGWTRARRAKSARGSSRLTLPTASLNWKNRPGQASSATQRCAKWPSRIPTSSSSKSARNFAAFSAPNTESQPLATGASNMGHHAADRPSDFQRTGATNTAATKPASADDRASDSQNTVAGPMSLTPTEVPGDALKLVSRDGSAFPPRFAVLRPHARGGLGIVHIALDHELNREVALKQIQERHADDATSRAIHV